MRGHVGISARRGGASAFGRDLDNRRSPDRIDPRVAAGLAAGAVLGLVAVFAGATIALVLGSAAVSVLALVGMRRGEASAGDALRPWPHVARLPLPLSGTELLDAEHGGRDRCGVVWHRPTGLMSTTVLLAPSEGLRHDPAVAETWAACWWNLLDAVCGRPEIVAAAVTVDVVAGEQAPLRLTLTVDPPATWHPVSSVADAAALTIRTLDRVDVGAAGLVVLRTAGPADLARITRGAFEPECPWIAPGAEPPAWGELAPRTETELPGVYRHERSHSVTWALHVPPRRRLAAEALPLLLRPGAFRRRVTLLRHGSPREVACSVFVTSSVRDPGELSAARAEVETLARPVQPRLQLCTGQQAAGFAVGLPVGWFPPHPQTRP